jgi:catechol 2,3-dioxygenase-like lactoylglutathione lyase family enzyme
MTAIHHIGITVPDLDRGIDFYHGVLGLEFASEPSPVFDHSELGPAVGVPGASLRQVCLHCGDSLVELLEYTQPDPPNEAPLPPNGIGAAHLAFRVEDIERAKAELEARGVEFLSRIQFVDAGVLAGWRWVYFRDPDGNTLELVQEAYQCPAERAAGIAEYKRRRESALSRIDRSEEHV